jgi:DNA-binding LacI/PurR family transcriptional regulator
MSDELALGALRAAARRGVPVPDGLAVTGWDDTEAAAPAGLTTVAQSLYDQGPAARSWPLAGRRPASTRRAGGSSTAPRRPGDRGGAGPGPLG